MYTTVVLLLMVSGCKTGVNAYSGGPPLSACETMAPDTAAHGASAQNTPSTYGVQLSNNTFMPGDTITVTLSSSDNTTFRGVFLQARLAVSSDTAPQGTFMLNEGEPELQLLGCTNKAGSAVSHNSNADKTLKTVTWKSPDTDIGNVKFRATFVKTRGEYWVGVESEMATGMGQATTATTTSGADNVAAIGVFLLVSVVLSVLYIR